MKKILVIDDDEAVRNSIADFLEDSNFDVTTAINGEDGIKKFKEDSFDIVLTDISMPKLNGYSVISEIKNKNSNIPIITISGLNRISDAMSAINNGAWDYITKPIINFDTLLHTINKNLEKSSLLQENEQYKKHLEDLIQQRTLELVEKNNELLFEIEKRKDAELEINRYKNELEKLVDERTEQLKNTNSRLNYTIETLKRTQSKLVETEKFAALGELVAGIAHEINTPIGVAVTASSFLEEKLKQLTKQIGDNPELISITKILNESSNLILNNLQKASKLIKSFKNIAVDQSSESIREFKLKEYLEDIILSLKPKLKRTKHKIEIIENKPLKIKSYPGAFSQIFTNLIMNSVIHGFEGIEEGKITIKINRYSDIVFIEYHDNGVGIPQENIKKIFEPFFTTKRNRGGSGLGMNLIYNLIVQKLNGEIIVESEINKGTTFIMKFKNSNDFIILGDQQ